MMVEEDPADTEAAARSERDRREERWVEAEIALLLMDVDLRDEGRVEAELAVAVMAVERRWRRHGHRRGFT